MHMHTHTHTHTRTHTHTHTNTCTQGCSVLDQPGFSCLIVGRMSLAKSIKAVWWRRGNLAAARLKFGVWSVEGEGAE